jgi:hypothetical protein
MSNKSMLRKFLPETPKKETPKEPRTRQEINNQYTQLAQLLGDKYVKSEGLKREIEQVLRAIDELGAELNARAEIEKKEAEKAKAAAPEVTKQADAGIPTKTPAEVFP